MVTILDLFPELKGNLSDYKVHLATAGSTDPLNAFLQDNFKDWQEGQSKKNFERNYIFSLIYFDEDEWLFAGIYKSLDCEWVEYKKHYEYDTKLMKINTELIGRLVIRYKRAGRQSYPNLENCMNDFYISQILKEKYSIIEFPGYEKTIINFSDLQTIIKKNDTSWYTALHNVKGVYVVTDRLNGKQYIGSAYGQYAFWTRWAQYSDNGHGGNVELKEIIKKNGLEYANNFQFSILEIRSTITDDSEIIEREQHWKNVLLTREFGYNKN